MSGFVNSGYLSNDSCVKILKMFGQMPTHGVYFITWTIDNYLLYVLTDGISRLVLTTRLT